MPGDYTPGKLLSTEHAAEYLDMPAARLRAYYKSWGIPVRKAGRELRFRVRDLDAWVDGQRAA